MDPPPPGASKRGTPLPRPYKQNRSSITDQQRRRDIALARQRAARQDYQAHARRLASTATWQPDKDTSTRRPSPSQNSAAANSTAANSTVANILGANSTVATVGIPVVEELPAWDIREAREGAHFVEEPPASQAGGEGEGDFSSSQSDSGVSSAQQSDHSTADNEDSESSAPGQGLGLKGRKEPRDGPSETTSGSTESREELQISELDMSTGSWVRINRDGRPLEGAMLVEAQEEGVQVARQPASTCQPPVLEPGSLNFNSGPQATESGSQDAAMDVSEDCAGSEAERGRGERSEDAAAAKKGLQEWYSQQLMNPEWMVDIPSKLPADWFVMARPEGRRCLVISSNGTTVSRLRNGRILHRFPSLLPNGARAKQVVAGANVYCILDCVFYEPEATYYILDVMAWKGYTLYSCAAEFRFFWLNSKLPETPDLLGAPPSHFHRFRFLQVQAHPCSEEGLGAAYSGPVPYRRDGLLFYNRHSHYTMGLTPLVLAWKDSLCSQYLIDTDAEGKVPDLQQVVLEYRADGTVATADVPPVVFGNLPAAFIQSNSKHLRPGLLLKFAIGPGGLSVTEGQLNQADLRYEGPANQRRGGADSFSKIMFQYSARRDPLTFSQILEATQATEMSMDEEDSGQISTDMPGLGDVGAGLAMC